MHAAQEDAALLREALAIRVSPASDFTNLTSQLPPLPLSPASPYEADAPRPIPPYYPDTPRPLPPY